MTKGHIAAIFVTLVFALVGILSPSPANADCGSSQHNESEQTPPYNPAILLKTYSCVRAQYDPETPSYEYADKILRPLFEAGINTLLTSPGGVTPEQRVQILNDYAFWTFKQGYRFTDSATILQTVVSLAPKRALAWLNLGDTYAAMMTSTEEDAGIVQMNQTWLGKQQLTRKAIDAYTHYESLTSMPAQHVQDFLALNPLNTSGDNVCQYMTSLFRENRALELTIPQTSNTSAIDLLGDGTKYYVYVYETGSANIPGIDGYTTPQNNVGPYYGDSHPGDVDFSPLDNMDDPGDRLYIFPYQNLYYVLRIAYSDANTADEGVTAPTVFSGSIYPPIESAQVIQPNNGVICSFLPNLSPELSVGRGKQLCEDFLHGHKFPRPLLDESQDETNIVLAPGLGGSYDLTATSDIDLEDNGRRQIVAYYNFSSGAGAGCDLNGIMLYDAKDRTASSGPLGQAMQNIPFSCGNPGDEFLIIYGGKVFIESDHWKATLPGEAKGQAIYAVRNEAVIPVCIIDNKFAYTLQSPPK